MTKLPSYQYKSLQFSVQVLQNWTICLMPKKLVLSSDVASTKIGLQTLVHMAAFHYGCTNYREPGKKCYTKY